MTKDLVLAILRKENNYVSGEKISSRLGVSRAAVNMAVKSLRAEGYEILSATNKGYYLNQVPDNLTEGELSAYLPAGRMASVLCLESADSTNNRLRELAFAGVPEGQVVLANEQTGGRGRRGRTFVSPKDQGIYLSILFRPESLPSDMTEITAWTAVAVSNAIEAVCGVRPGIKWVNDLFLNQKKICGILTEMSVESESGQIQYVLIGIGVNVSESETDFPEEIRPIATSIQKETNKTCMRAQLAAKMIEELDRMRSLWPQGKQRYLDAYRAASVTVGEKVAVIRPQGEKTGTAVRINDDFSLLVRFADGSEESIAHGEVRALCTGDCY